MKSSIKKILIISLSNIGDVVLTFPVVDVLRRDFPQSEISIVVGPKAEPLLKDNPHFERVYVFDKHQFFTRTIKWVWALRREQFDFVIDLRNTAIPFMIGVPYKTPVATKHSLGHMKQKHLNRLRLVHPYESESLIRYSVFINDQVKSFVDDLVAKEIGPAVKFVTIAPSAADSAKRWPAEKYADLSDWLIQDSGCKIIFVGDADQDAVVVQNILKNMKHPALDLSGKLTLIQLAELLNRSSLVIGNDSAPMHLASYFDKPAITLFGPTDPRQYGPWSSHSYALKKDIQCPRCQNKKSLEDHICLQSIEVKDIIQILKTDLFLNTLSG